MSLIRLRADAVPVAGCARVVRLSRDADGVLVFVEGDAGGCERNGAKLISERLWEDCRAALRLQPNPGPEAEFASRLAPTETSAPTVASWFPL